MTTGDLTRVVKKFAIANGRGPNSIEEPQEAMISELNTSVSDVDVREEFEKAIQVGSVGRDADGCLVVI